MCVECVQSNHNRPVRIVNVSSKMHELAGAFQTDDPHFVRAGAYSSMAAYNRSKLAQAGHNPPDLTHFATRQTSHPACGVVQLSDGEITILYNSVIFIDQSIICFLWHDDHVKALWTLHHGQWRNWSDVLIRVGDTRKALMCRCCSPRSCGGGCRPRAASWRRPCIPGRS